MPEANLDLAQGATAVVAFPLPYGALGHYRVNHRCLLIAAQAAGSRIFSVRNAGTDLLIPTSFSVTWLQTAAHTAAIEDSLDLYRLTSYTAVDTVNTVTPTASVKRTAGMAAAPGSALIRGVTVAGATAGMTGGTLTKDGGTFDSLSQWLLAAQPTGQVVIPQVMNALTDGGGVQNGTHPWVLAANEGFELENRVLLGAAAGSSVYIDFSWAEVPAGSY